MSLVSIKRRAEGGVYEAETYEKMDLRSMKGFGSKFTNCLFTDTMLDLSDLRNCRFDGCTFVSCEVQRAEFSSSFFEETSFHDCNLEQTSFMGCHLAETTFSDCRMAYGETLFQNATAKKLRFVKCNLHGSNLDFREANGLSFDDSNVWGAKISLGCAFWNADFDERTCRRFVAMVARVYPDLETKSKLIDLAGDQYPVVERAMRETKR